MAAFLLSRSGLIALLLAGGAAQAQDVTDAPARIGGKPVPAPCVSVDVGGYKAGTLDCATRKLEEAAGAAQSQARAGIDAPVLSATSSDVRVGVANQAATKLRMGNSFGTSVHPQRPSRPPPMPRPGGRR